MGSYPETRLRRLRTPRLRRLTDAPPPAASQFLWPVFVRPGTGVREEIPSLPGQRRWSVDTVVDAVGPVAEQGVGGVLLFGLVDDGAKDEMGTAAVDPEGVVPQALRALREACPDLALVTDVCLCGATDHGQCGPLADDGDVDNDAAVAQLGRVAVAHAGADADIVAPSAMMDGQVAGIRAALDEAGFANTPIMSYSTKFASAMYGPFRDAADSAPGKGDRQGYQASWANPRLAWRESELDAEEGADLLMVKPAATYLDIIADIREGTDLPLAAYHVSGEYGMLHAAAERGWGELDAMAREVTGAIFRAGADLVISYFANRYREIFHG